MVLSKDNVKGVVLALLSSAFIGGSFIIKKKGLKRAAAFSGVRAGVGGYSYLLEPLWWVGMIASKLWNPSFSCAVFMAISLLDGSKIEGALEILFVAGLVSGAVIIGEAANFVAYAFAPAVLVTPLGALSIIVSAVLAHFILKERLHKLGILGCVMCVAGSVIIVVHAPREHTITSVQEIWAMATQQAFLLYVGSVLVLVFILVFHFSPQCGHSNVLVFLGICSLMGSLSVMSAKALGTALKLTFEGNNQLTYPETWFFFLVMMTCVVIQMNYLNKALDTFNTAVVSPIYYVLFTTLTIFASVIMFKDWDGQCTESIISEICGFITVLSGTILLLSTKDFERSSSFGGGYTPGSPSLCTRLYNGNSDCRYGEDDTPLLEEVCMRRQ